MNRVYRLVWNRVRGCLVVASEIARARGRQSGSATTRPTRWLLTVPLGLAPLFAWALPPSTMSPITRSPVTTTATPAAAIGRSTSPGGGRVTAGNGNISQRGLVTTIDQRSQNLSLNWQSFNIGADSTVNFVQPNAQAIAVNRIADANGSVILGRLNANGQVFLINPNGVLFGQGAQVNVGGLVASTLDANDSELGRGTLHLTGDSDARVVNQGTITANGGYVALVGAQVVNQGTLAANGGSVAMGGGNAVTLSFDGNRLLGLQVDKSALNALAENRQLIVADGGQVLMSAGAKDALLASVVNNSGTIQARTVENRTGRIVLLGGMAAGQTTVAGSLDASAPNGGHGGFVETSAAHVTVAPGARITTAAANGHTGHWLIDPVDYTIAASGGDITGAQLSANLGTSNVTILSSAGTHGGTNGDINVNDTVAWSANKLTLNAQNNININTAMYGSGTASLALEYGQGAVAAGNTSTVNVRAPVNLPAGNNFSTTLGSDGTLVNYTVITSLGAAGSATSTDLQGINGNLAGNYVLGASIDASATSGWNGGAGFAPLGEDVGTLAFTGIFDGLRHTISGLIINRPDTDFVGLFGLMDSSTIRNLGLLGGSVTGKDNVGGMVGWSNHSTITQAYATGAVEGNNEVGGLVGYNVGSSTISQAYATGPVTGNEIVGGLVGNNFASTISQAYATGAVSGSDYVGGLAGVNGGPSAISQTYATGRVSGGGHFGGFAGYSVSNSITTSYWDTYSTGQANSVGDGSATGITAITSNPAQAGAANYAFKQGAYADFDFTPGAGAWFMVDGSTRPFLQSEYSTTINNAHQLQLVAMDLAANYTLGSDIDAAATGLPGGIRAGMWSGNGFVPIGNSTTSFSGIFDGLGHRVSNLSINPAGSPSYVGLFGSTAAGAEIRNVGLVDVSLAGGNGQVGALVGSNEGKVSNSFATGTVIGATHVGGLVGDNWGTIDGSYFSGSAIAGNRLGGLVGINIGSISTSYSSGRVISSAAQDFIGGLVGDNSGTISVSYASATVSNGNPDPNSRTGSLAGNNSGSVSDSYWNTGLSALPGIDGGTATGASGLSAAAMMQQSSFAGWDLASTGGSSAVWRIYEGQTAPLLRSFMTNLAVTADITTTYNGAAFAGSTDYTFSALAPSQWLPSNTVDPGLLYGSATTAASAVNVGSYALTDGPYSGQMGYDIDFTAGTLTINPAALTISSSDVGKTYDGGLSAAGTAVVTGGTLFGTDALSGGSFAFVDKNAGTGKTVSVSGVTVDDGNGGGNYTITYADNTTSTIFAKAIASVGGIGADSKIYDGNTTATLDLSGATFAGMISGDSLTVASAAGSFSDKNAANGKTVSIGAITLGGGDAGNYTLTDDTASATADIVRRAINVDTVVSDKVYDGTTDATLSVGSAGILAGDAVLLSGSGHFADRNVGTAKAVAVDVNASGADAGNYNFHAASGTTADITPATLVYQANATSSSSGGPWGLLGGTVSGLVGGDTLDEATDGTLAWQTPATAVSPAGTYAIDGSGLSARNYVFVQAAGNATALHLLASDAPGPIAVPALVGRTVAGLQQTADNDKTSVLYAPDVRVINGGVHLP